MFLSPRHFPGVFRLEFVSGAPCRFGLQVLRVEYRLQDPSLGGRFGSGEDDDLDRDRGSSDLKRS